VRIGISKENHRNPFVFNVWKSQTAQNHLAFGGWNQEPLFGLLERGRSEPATGDQARRGAVLTRSAVDSGRIGSSPSDDSTLDPVPVARRLPSRQLFGCDATAAALRAGCKRVARRF
jgi:hypothetical protein